MKWKKWLSAVPVAIGAVVLIALVRSRTGPEERPQTESAKVVRVIEASPVTVVPRASGYGVAEPSRSWDAVAQVSGRIVYQHPRLQNGELISSGTLLFRIDPSDYQLALRQQEQAIRRLEAQLRELETERRNAEKSLELEKQSLDLARRDLERSRELLAKVSISDAAYEQKEREVLNQRIKVLSLENALNRIPNQKDSLEADLEITESKLEQAKLNVQRTALEAPFDCRVAEVLVEQSQYASPGQTLARVDGIETTEVTAQILMNELQPLIPRELAEEYSSGIGKEVPPGKWTESLGFGASVRLESGDFRVEWEARFARLSDLFDPKTRTVGVVVEVDEPFRRVVPGVRPPLYKGMFVEVEIRGEPLPDQIVIPREAITEGHVFIADAENRLQVRPVTVAFFQDNFAVIDQGVEPGDRVVVSDLLPAIKGMLLEPERDQELEERIAVYVGGGETP